MTRIHTLIMTAALTSALAACGGGGGAAPAPSQPPVAPTNTATVSTQSVANVAAGDKLTVTWSNTNNDACTGNGLLAGAVTGASGTTQVAPAAQGEAVYSVTCGAATSNEVKLHVLPAITLITDPVFEQALIDAGIDDVLDGQVATSKILGVTKLAIMANTYDLGKDTIVVGTNGKKISDLTGLENFRNLTVLRLEGQKFAAIDTSSLSELSTLIVWQAPITSIDLSHNAKLTMLGISETGLTSVDLSALTQLVELDVQNAFALPYVLPNGANVQGLESLDLSKNVKLQRLYASYNRLTTLDLSHNAALTEAHLDHNQLTSVNTTGITATIDTSFNPMTP